MSDSHAAGKASGRGFFGRNPWVMGLLLWLCVPALFSAPLVRVDFDVGEGWEPAHGYEHTITNLPPNAAFGDVAVMRSPGRSTPILMWAMVSGSVLERVRIERWEKTDEGWRYFALRLRKALVTGYHIQTDEPGMEERISLNPTDFEWTFITTKGNGRGATALSTGRDLDNSDSEPRDPDSDGDGMPDSYEVRENLLILLDDGDADDDGDFFKNRDEFLAGTSASDPNSLLRVEGVTRPAEGGGMVSDLTFQSVADRTYDVYSGHSLDVPFTGPIRTLVATGDTTTATVQLPPGHLFVTVRVR